MGSGALDCLPLSENVAFSWFKQNNYSRQTKDTVNYCVLISKLLELMGDERNAVGKNNNIQI